MDGGATVRSRLRTSRFSIRRLTESVSSLLEGLGESRLFWQTIISVVIFFAVVGMSRLPLKTSELLVRAVRYTVTDDYDFVAVWKGFPSIDEIRTNYLQGIIDWLKSSRPRSPGITEKPIWPVDGKVVSGYGWRTDPVTKQERLQEGIDIEAREGAPIKAVLSGVVAGVRESPTYGKLIEIDHGNGLMTLYAHCSEILVTPSSKVKQGDTIALVGKTGTATNPHLHFEVIENGRTIDPLKKLFQGGT